MSVDTFLLILKTGNTGKKGAQYHNQNAVGPHAENDVVREEGVGRNPWERQGPQPVINPLPEGVARTFKKIDEADAWASRYMVPKEELSITSRLALRAYKAGMSNSMNHTLRLEARGEKVSDTGNMTEAVQGIDDAFMKTPEDIQVHRYYSSKHSALDTSTLKVGDIIEDAGYLSTTLLKRVASSFGDTPKAMAEIYIPKGTPAIYMEHHRSDLVPYHEAELLMPRHTKLKVESIKTGLKPRLKLRVV